MQPFNNNTFLKYTVDNPIQNDLQGVVQNTIGKQLGNTLPSEQQPMNNMQPQQNGAWDDNTAGV